MDMVGCNPNYVFNMGVVKLENKKMIMTKEELIKKYDKLFNYL
jgi:hypothetical protein